MRRLATVLFASALVLGAYVWSFGMPAYLSALVSGLTETSPQPSVPASAADRPSRRGGGATTVVLEPLARQPYEHVLRAIGSTVAWQSVDVVSSVSGTVTAISMQANRDVAAGDVLVELDDRIERLKLEIAQAELDQARRTVARYENLPDSAALTSVDIDDAAVAARLAEATVGLAKIALEDRSIRAPIAGRPGLSDVEVGDRISSDQVIVTIDNTETLLIEFELPERSIGLLEPGRTVRASTPVFTGRVFKGQIIAFDSRLDDVTRSVTVHARIENPDRMLWSGMTFGIRMIDQSDPLPVVPATAITWTRDGSAIWIDRDGVASRFPVTILYRAGDQVWIDADIDEGTSIVTEGAQKLREGAALRAAEAGELPDEGPV